ncbi:hypothetical protein TcCL_NonESM06178, partial [Trypanosoma cruzi]
SGTLFTLLCPATSPPLSHHVGGEFVARREQDKGMNCTSLRHSVAAITAPRNPESIQASLKRKKHTAVWNKWAALEGRQLALQRPYECAWAWLEEQKY